jgi:hypothetical protein
MTQSQQTHRSDLDLQLSDIPTSTLVAAMEEKYNLDLKVIHEALEILWAFFLQMKKDRTQLLVLPQIADWAWHEFILISKQYHCYVNRIFGSDLPHMRITRDDDAFDATKRVFSKTYGFNVESAIWNESGWGSPAYRFHECWRENISKLEEYVMRKFKENMLYQSTVKDFYVDLGWLVERLQQRFHIQQATAKLAVHFYILYLDSLAEGEKCHINHIPSLALWAWQEHMLWTEKYKNDCGKLFGKYLHRPFIPASQLFSTPGVC